MNILTKLKMRLSALRLMWKVFRLLRKARKTKPTKTNDAQRILNDRLKETAQATNRNSTNKTKIPTGTRIENYYKEYEKQPLKPKRGRPKKYPRSRIIYNPNSNSKHRRRQNPNPLRVSMMLARQT